MCDAVAWLAIAFLVLVTGAVALPIIIALRGGYDPVRKVRPRREPLWRIDKPERAAKESK